MDRRLFSSLRSRLIILVLLTLLPALGFIVLDAAEQRSMSAAGAERDALWLAQMAGAEHERSIFSARRLLTAAAELPELHAAPDVCSRRLAGLLDGGGFTNFAVVDLSGALRCSALPVSRPMNFSDQAWFQRVVHGSSFAVGAYTTGAVTGLPILAIGAPLRDARGRLDGVLSAGLDLTWFGSVSHTNRLPEHTSVTVLDERGEVLLSTPPAPAGQELIRTVLLQRSGTAALPGVDGVRRLYGFTELASNGDGAFLVIGIPADIAYADANRRAARNLMAFVLVIALALVCALLLAEQLLLRYLRPLARTARRLAGGDLAARTGLAHRGEGELSELALAFDRMAATLQEREAEVHRSAEERVLLERRLLHTQHIESLGVIAGGVAHDFNNLLAIIRGNVGLALLDLPRDSPLHDMLGAIDAAARRAAELTGQMLTYAGRSRFTVEPLNLNELIGEVGELLRTAVPPHVELRYELAGALPPVIADAAQIRQVVINLVSNAGEAMEERPGRLTIGTGECAADSELLAGCVVVPEQPAGRFVCLTVADQGHGMDRETLARSFEPFFTTRFIGRGLGLAAVLGIVRGHQGALCVESEPECGTTVRVLLPALPRSG